MPDTTYIHYCYTNNISDSDFTKALSLLPPWRQKQTLSLRRINDQVNSILSFLLLKYQIMQAGISDQIIGRIFVNKWNFGEFGKPYYAVDLLKSGLNAKKFNSTESNKIELKSNFFFNITHTDNLVATIYSLNFPCGIDVENKTKNQPKTKINIDEWVIKEAYCKMQGVGISDKFDQINIEELKATSSIGFFNQQLNWQEQEFSLAACVKTPTNIESDFIFSQVAYADLLSCS